MQKLLFASAIVVLLVTHGAVAPALAINGETPVWRLGASYDYLTSGGARDALGNGFNIQLERSFGPVLMDGDVSAEFAYRRFSGSSGGFDNDLNYFSLGPKLRIGPGASPATDGYYAGAAIGLAILNANIGGQSTTDVNFQWALLGGINFASRWYGEVTYASPDDVLGVNANNLAFLLGYRF